MGSSRVPRNLALWDYAGEKVGIGGVFDSVHTEVHLHHRCSGLVGRSLSWRCLLGACGVGAGAGGVPDRIANGLRSSYVRHLGAWGTIITGA